MKKRRNSGQQPNKSLKVGQAKQFKKRKSFRERRGIKERAF
jgi:hypothetical protein